MSTAGNLLFVISAAVAIAGAVGTITARSPLRAAMALLAHIVALAGVFLTLHAHLLAALQLLVYAGAVVVLFVFVVMLIGPSAELPPRAVTDDGPEDRPHAERAPRTHVPKTIGAVLCLVWMAAIGSQLLLVEGTRATIEACPRGGPQSQAECGQFGGVAALGQAVYRKAAVPFELISVLLTVAIVGAVAVARGRSAKEQEQAEQRKRARAAAEAARQEREKQLTAEVATHGGH